MKKFLQTLKNAVCTVVGGCVAAVGSFARSINQAADTIADAIAPAAPVEPPKVAVPVVQRGVRPVLQTARRAVAFAATVAFAVVTVGSALAADPTPGSIDAGIDGAVTSFSATFTAVKGAVLTILVFAVGYKLAKKWLK